MTSGRDYPRLSIEDFGRVLLDTGDLDPVYIALHRMRLPRDQLCRWLVAYWCCYHCGAASWLSEPGRDFWRYMEEMAANKKPAPTGGRWPRGAERRHWRGAQAMSSVLSLEEACLDEEDLVGSLLVGDHEGAVPFATIRENVLKWRGFGPWIAFKIGDMLDRLGICPVSFEQAEVFMFDTPRKAAIELWRAKTGLPESARPRDEGAVISEVVSYLANHFNGYLAPPLDDRVVGVQEIETILCKWKSHMSGHYPLGKDTREIAEGLDEWRHVSKTADVMHQWMDTIERNW